MILALLGLAGHSSGPMKTPRVMNECNDRQPWIDLGTELREPGFEEDETIETGAAAAVAGGFTSIACLPNTDPPIDSQASVEFVQLQAARANLCHVFVLACVSKNREGRELSEMGLLAQAGAVGFTDANLPVSNAELMRRALEYTQMFDIPIISHAEDEFLCADGVMNESFEATRLGMNGRPPVGEVIAILRDIKLCQYLGGRVHIAHVSTADGVEAIRV